MTKSKLFTWLFALIALASGLLALYIWAAMNWNYSTGERAGYLQKLSKKGWLCKTWEGELSLIAIPGAAPEKFLFTVRDDDVARKVDTTMGKRVSLTYEEHLGLPTTCFGDTAYFVTGVKEVLP